MTLSDLGWNPHVQRCFEAFASQGLIPARVSREDRERYRLMSSAGDLDGEVSGRFRHGALSRADYPGVGDWVAVRPPPEGGAAIIHAVLPRHSCFRRKVPGNRTEEQVIAANLDVVLVVCGLDGGRNFNLRRLERTLILVGDSGAAPAVVLNKQDLCSDVGEAIRHARTAAPGAPILCTSAAAGTGLDDLRALLGHGVTGALVGPSGVGKSSLVNALLNEDRMTTAANRDDDRRGRHTTTHRELIPIPGGGILIDTPGMRELQLWGDDDRALDETFADIEALARACRFADCTHLATPGCAVAEAVDQGALPADRLESYFHLQREMAYLARRQDQRAQRAERDRWKKISRFQRQVKKRQR